MVPRAAFQLTVVLDVEPCTVAVKETVLPTATEGAAGEIVTEVTAAAAVPCKGTTNGLALALLMKLSEPLTVPAELELNVTVKL
jgi:hypothetical protein